MASRKTRVDHNIARGKQTALEVLKLRKEGGTFSEIGKKLGITRQAANYAYWRGIEAVEEELSNLAREVRCRQLMHCSEVYETKKEIALSNTEGADSAHRQIMDAFGVERKLLGLELKDAPNPAEVAEFHGSIEDRRAQLLEIVVAAIPGSEGKNDSPQ